MTVAGWLLIASLAATCCACSQRHDVLPAAQTAAADRAYAWLLTQQQPDGSFDAGFGHPAGLTCDAVLAAAATGADPTTTGQPSMTDYLASSADEYALDAATTGKLIVALVAARLNPYDFAGRDWVAQLDTHRSAEGAFDGGTVGQSWAMIAQSSVGEKLPAAELDVLKSYQLDTGSWSSSFGPDNDTVSYALQALAAAGEPADSEVVHRTVSFLLEQQNEDGGFPAIKPSDWGTDSNANSTANVVMALRAIGEDPTGARWTKPGGNPLSALLALQADDGRIEFQPGIGEPLLSTVQGIPALMNTSLPLVPR